MGKLTGEMVHRLKQARKYKWTPWNMWTHGISWSFVECFLRNRKECEIKYRQGYRPKSEASIYLVFGNAFHEVMERVYRGCDGPPSSERVRKYIKIWYDRDFPKNTYGPLRENLEKFVRLAEVSALAYFENYIGDFKTEWVDSEIKISFPYEYPDGCKLNLTGYIDILGRIKKTQKLVVYDTKTKGEINEDDILSEMPINFQFNLYMCYVRWRYKECPGGAVMNIVRRPGHRQKKGESLSDFAERVFQDMRARPEHFFKRLSYDILDSDLDWWWKNQLVPIMDDIRSWQERDFPSYVNPTGLRIGRRKSDYFNALTQDDFSDLEKVV